MWDGLYFPVRGLGGHREVEEAVDLMVNRRHFMGRRVGGILSDRHAGISMILLDFERNDAGLNSEH